MFINDEFVIYSDLLKRYERRLKNDVKKSAV